MDDRQPVVCDWVSGVGFGLINITLIKVELASLTPRWRPRRGIGVNT
jgi:hypothetical protein